MIDRALANMNFIQVDICYVQLYPLNRTLLGAESVSPLETTTSFTLFMGAPSRI
jgi:hypothetical protein